MFDSELLKGAVLKKPKLESFSDITKENKQSDFETNFIDLDKTKRADAAIRTAEAMNKAVNALNDITVKINTLSDALETERQIRQEADKRQGEMINKTYKTAKYTLWANWIAAGIAVISLILTIFLRN